MDGSCLVALVCLGRYYLPAPLSLFSQHWYLLGLPLGYPSWRSSAIAVLLGPDSVW